MSGLIPDPIHETIASQTLYSTSETFGLVVFVLLLVLLVEREAIAAARPTSNPSVFLSTICVPLLVVFLTTAVARVLVLLP
jgi:hypothetical protein